MEGIEFFTEELESEETEIDDGFGEIEIKDEDDDDMVEDVFDDIDNF